jgi:hypothetical protein
MCPSFSIWFKSFFTSSRRAWTLCEEFSDILTSQPGRTDIKHEIKTTSETPISLRPYRIPYARRDEVKKLLNQMLKDGHIVPSKSPWSSPIVLIAAKTKPKQWFGFGCYTV